MKSFILIILVIAFISLSINTVSARCFWTGAKWQDRAAARQHVVNACKGHSGYLGAFQGTFAAGEAAHTCVQHSPTQKLEFMVQNLNIYHAFDLADDECVLRLQNEINSYARGGSSMISGWVFRADPSNGIC
ncbi:hypothetical protein FOXG_01363 [Fusarium oxysporum f. sp. lycopersici 4287]|uniref:Secreted protein n=3 Tax=Fusarium oxysporum TaxID=5507 RepID=A0A0J9UAG0_FUSO4|nr:hypothetical protein FOXG_01363 [Fusarium oxysporum f. sp. lycopersici 4287]EXK49724.1 hypothetical protein FOMG_02209 [Fusarium oxysporum f. sp. melonis 26406]KAJ9427920.1 hypothetical protein QL093DRAFT_2091112 [Fusarium oxysporum]KNA96004.1 hypothetical protein FOXG_01363 [Fusarium oxysporum f. sp. lycopersici 4287]